MTEDTKTCKKCGETKPTSHFNASSKSDDGINPRCRACVNAARRANTRRKKVKPEESAGRQLIAAAKKGDLAKVKKLYRQVPQCNLEALLFWTIQAHGPRKEANQRYATSSYQRARIPTLVLPMGHWCVLPLVSVFLVLSTS